MKLPRAAVQKVAGTVGDMRLKTRTQETSLRWKRTENSFQNAHKSKLTCQILKYFMFGSTYISRVNLPSLDEGLVDTVIALALYGLNSLFIALLILIVIAGFAIAKMK